MTFALRIETDNAAFHVTGGLEDVASAAEVARILHKLAESLEAFTEIAYGESGNLQDHNGNTVGVWDIK